MPNQVVAYVLIVTNVGTENEVVKKIEQIDGVTLAQTVYGEFDIISRVECDNLKDLDNSITRIRKITNIIRTLTLISG